MAFSLEVMAERGASFRVTAVCLYLVRNGAPQGGSITVHNSWLQIELN